MTIDLIFFSTLNIFPFSSSNLHCTLWWCGMHRNEKEKMKARRNLVTLESLKNKIKKEKMCIISSDLISPRDSILYSSSDKAFSHSCRSPIWYQNCQGSCLLLALHTLYHLLFISSAPNSMEHVYGSPSRSNPPFPYDKKGNSQERRILYRVY